ncbi:MAG: glycosyltransferase family 2 protein [Bacteroidales bacterium]|nr:glycosyltransferase family 2 protein [Bacteroidales bacterium]
MNTISEDILVSVAVITYNSSKYVLETLESIKAQTYQNVELIISDDCSTDNTMQLCKKWCEQNKERFTRIQYVEVEQNTGVSANCNRAEDACEGGWVKLIAGDDMLLPNCITDFMEYVQLHKDVVYVFGWVKCFGDRELVRYFENEVFDKSFFSLSLEQQYYRLINNGNCLPAAACLYNKNKKKNLGLSFDERIPLLEDLPMWLNVLKAGVKLRFLDKEVVLYRVTSGSLCVGEMSSNFLRSNLLYYFLYVYDEKYNLNKLSTVKSTVEYIMNTCDKNGTFSKKYNSVVNSHAYRLGCFLLQPVYWIKKILGINR